MAQPVAAVSTEVVSLVAPMAEANAAVSRVVEV